MNTRIETAWPLTPAIRVGNTADRFRARGWNPEQIVLITADGDSMEPTIRKNDGLLVDISIDRVTRDGIYVYATASGLFVKRIQRCFDGTIIIIPDNPAYQRQHLSADQARQLLVFGRVVGIGKCIG